MNADVGADVGQIGEACPYCMLCVARCKCLRLVVDSIGSSGCADIPSSGGDGGADEDRVGDADNEADYL